MGKKCIFPIIVFLQHIKYFTIWCDIAWGHTIVYGTKAITGGKELFNSKSLL